MRLTKRTMFRSIMALAIVFVVMVSATRLSGPPEAHGLGVEKGLLKRCPDSPNCVSSQCEDGLHYLAPIAMTASLEKTIEAITAVLSRRNGVRVTTCKDDYVHAIATSRIMRFVDDIEFVVDEANRVIHFRSASRVGYHDLGVNRKRMESLLAELRQDLH